MDVLIQTFSNWGQRRQTVRKEKGHKSGRWDLTQLKDSPFDTEDLARETSPEAQKKWRAINKAKKQEAPV